MTDRELLELAAKAAGIEHVTPMMVEWGKWNPLEDDGDALRLAVKLFLTVEVEDGFSEAISEWSSNIEAHNGDSCAATRRAIVKAAAKIGRAM